MEKILINAKLDDLEYIFLVNMSRRVKLRTFFDNLNFDNFASVVNCDLMIEDDKDLIFDLLLEQ